MRIGGVTKYYHIVSFCTIPILYILFTFSMLASCFLALLMGFHVIWLARYIRRYYTGRKRINSTHQFEITTLRKRDTLFAFQQAVNQQCRTNNSNQRVEPEYHHRSSNRQMMYYLPKEDVLEIASPYGQEYGFETGTIIETLINFIAKAHTHTSNDTMKKLEDKIVEKMGLKPEKKETVVEIIEENMATNLETLFSQINTAYKQINTILMRCFGLRLIISGASYQQTIKIGELRRLIKIIQHQKCIPKHLNCTLPFGVVLKELEELKQRLPMMPDLSQEPSTVKMRLYLMCLESQFSQEKIVVIDVNRRVSCQKMETHYFSLFEDGYICYNRNPQYRNKNCSIFILFFCLQVAKRYYRSNKQMIINLAHYMK